MDRSLDNTRPRESIRRRVLIAVLLTTLGGILIAAITGIVCINWIKDSSESALKVQLENNLKSVVLQKAVAADAKLEHYEKYIAFVTDYIEEMYADEETMIERGHMFYPPRNTKEYKMTRGIASADLTADDLKDEILFFSNLEPIWAPIAKENKSLITTVYLGTTSGLLVSYDRWSYLSAMPKGEEQVYNFFETGWYKQGLVESGPFYTGLYMDSQGRGLTITIASPFTDGKGNIKGVDSADFDITGLYDELLSIDLGEDAFSFALDKTGAIISPDAEGVSVEEYTGLTLQEIEELKAEPDRILEKNNAIYVGVPIERVGWLLCASIPKEAIQKGISDTDRLIQSIVFGFTILIVIIIIIDVIVVRKVASSITKPMEQLDRDIKAIADGDLNYRATVQRNDEIGDITSRMNEMVDRLNFTINELSSTQQHADAMSRLATRDSLTGIRNKTAYTEQARILDEGIALGNCEFGLAMIDLNNLKLINDLYGHAKGDEAIIKLSRIICDVFSHSPVFRIGGDEFVVVLQDSSYNDAASLVARFESRIGAVSRNDQLDPWKRVSAAIGYALFDKATDANAQSVLDRADQEMYKHKRAMKDGL